jgi:hypothetical protein
MADTDRTSEVFEKLKLPKETRALLRAAPSVTWFDNVDDLLVAAVGGPESVQSSVTFELPGGKAVTEANVMRLRNGINVQYPDPYMRRRDPDCMFIADDAPTNKTRFRDRFGYEFEKLRKEALDWLATQDLAAFAYKSGHRSVGLDSVAIAPANCGFFAAGLAMLQGIVPLEDLTDAFDCQSVLYVAPPFRHTHFDGKQVVVHDRNEDLHEMFAFNLYPGPSAKKGVYGVLINRGEKEGWITAHCSAVQVVTPYDNVVTFMHEGASGGGKSEMLEHIHREPDGRLLLGRNVVTGDSRHLEIPRACELRPVTDDMAMCHPSVQGDDGRLTLLDAESAWFVRVNHIDQYGTDPVLEKLTVQPPSPLIFMSIDAVPDSRALIFEHQEDAPGQPCPNPRVILPREMMPNVVNEPVTVDIRSFGVRTPPCTREKPTYGILGLTQLLPPALAWLWRLVAPRGHANPSVVDSQGMTSEGVGSYWPFATGRRIDQANLLLTQFRQTPRTRYILCPNQYVGSWKTSFMPQWVAREYFARRGHAKFKSDQVVAARCSLLGYALNQLSVEGRAVPPPFLQVNLQHEVGRTAYDRGAELLHEFFRQQLEMFLESDLDPLGREIINCCFDKGTVEDYERLIPQV